MSLATVGAVVGIAAGANSLMNSGSSGGGGGGGGAQGAADPFGPYRGGWASTLNSFMQNPQSITSTPGYQQNLATGEQSLLRADSAMGKSGSGAEHAALTQYGQNYAASQWSNYVNILSQLSGASWQAGGNAANANLATTQMQNQQYGQALGGIISGAQSLYNNWGSWGSTNTNTSSQQSALNDFTAGWNSSNYG